MPNPAFHELQKITEIVAKAQGLSPDSIRYVRAQLLALVKDGAANPIGSGQPEPHVLEAQEKTGKLFRQRAEGE